MPHLVHKHLLYVNSEQMGNQRSFVGQSWMFLPLGGGCSSGKEFQTEENGKR